MGPKSYYTISLVITPGGGPMTTLFNWADFKSLEIGGCISHDGCIEGGIADDRAEFWTVYARDHDGCAQAITDCPTRSAADKIGRTLSEMSDLPLL